MLENHEHIADLISSYNNGTINEAQKDELDNWITESNINQQLFEELSDPEQIRKSFRELIVFTNEATNWEKIRHALLKPNTSVRRIFRWKKIAIAASLILMVGVGTYYAFFNKSLKKTQIVKKEPVKSDVEAPKETKATITLADGRTFLVDSLNTIEQANVKLTKTADGKIVYQSSVGSLQSAVLYNTLTNPLGSKVIDMQLADGSHVWLNAGSSVTYPVAFVGNERRVSITGEAYFEIAHDASKPFNVSKGDMNVQVFGTKFNVNAYDDESDIKVTLLEGSVKVSKGNKTGLLKPGQQAQVSGVVKVVSGVDLAVVMAWRDGYFKFNKTDIQTMMRQAEKWYNITVSYPGGVPEEKFGGTLSRSVNLSEFVKILAYSEVKAKIEGRNVIISK